MDDRKLQAVREALAWEAAYYKREHLSGKGAFLPSLDVLDSDFAQALELFGIKGGRLLEIGTGLGTQARCFARLGFEVTATDVSPTCVDTARIAAAKAGDCGNIEFVADNILLTVLQGPYDLITDRGCYTLMQEWMREQYCRNVRRLLAPAGWLLIKIDAGRRDEIRSLETCFRILQSCPSRYSLEWGHEAYFFVMRPRA